MFCGIIDLFSPSTSFRALRSMGEPYAGTLPCASAYLNGGVGLFLRNQDRFLTYPITKTVDGRSYTLMIEGRAETSADDIILHFSKEGEAFLRRLCGSFSLALFDLSTDTLYLMRKKDGAPVYFSGDIRLIFATSEEALSAFPERLFGISRLRENSILKYNIQGVGFL